MDTLKMFGFTEDQFNTLINQKPRSHNTDGLANTSHEQLVKILNLKKKQIETELHAEFLIEYLKAGVIPVGLQVRNEPGLFVENPKFLETWTHIAN